MKTRLLLALALSLFTASASASDPAGKSASNQTEWTLDAAHAHVGFSVAHMVVAETEGEFKAFSGKVLLDEKDVTKSSVELTIEAKSIDTGNADRDAHLRNGDFLDVDKHPRITFKSTQITKAGKGYKIKGDMTIRGVTKQVVLDATLSEAVVNPWGKQVRAARITGKINRQDFGVSWNKGLDKGGLAVGNEVTFDVKVELNK
jgi:polyisoprenoid-binding protein YceI